MVTNTEHFPSFFRAFCTKTETDVLQGGPPGGTWHPASILRSRIGTFRLPRFQGVVHGIYAPQLQPCINHLHCALKSGSRGPANSGLSPFFIIYGCCCWALLPGRFTFVKFMSKIERLSNKISEWKPIFRNVCNRKIRIDSAIRADTWAFSASRKVIFAWKLNLKFSLVCKYDVYVIWRDRGGQLGRIARSEQMSSIFVIHVTNCRDAWRAIAYVYYLHARVTSELCIDVRWYQGCQLFPK